MARKVFVIGLDCAPPEFVFDQFGDVMPHTRGLMEQGLWGPIRSVHPPITVPAWTCMMTSKTPGHLGFYGFRNRKSHDYDEMFFANNRAVKEDRAWDVISRAGRKVVVVGVPQTYPPDAVNGIMISSFLTPSIDSPYTYPKSLKKEIADVVGEYVLDVRNFRTDDKDSLLKQIYDMTETRFNLVKHFLVKKPWDFFMFVEMGTDRIHHGFWRYTDPRHRLFEKGNRYEGVMRDYYAFLDRGIGEMLSLVDDDTAVIVVSDHGARPMTGGVCFNEWLIREGYLEVKEYPKEPKPLRNDNIVWEKTKAWGSGGYYGRLFLNVKGREPNGTIEPGDYEKVRSEIIEKIAALEDHEGRNMGSSAHRPEDLYDGVVRGVAPDLIVYFGDLSWRSVGSIGIGEVLTFENDTGPDDANHDWDGIFILKDGDRFKNEKREGMSLLDVGPTVLDLMGMPVPQDMLGKVIR
jgi:predicted AlkP superfamily phosphohydrolase/phosphomutase